MKITLTANEGRKVLDALVDVALSHGWNEDELEESGVIEEYTTAVDAAMKAMGLELEVNPEVEDEDEDYEEESEDEEEDEEEELSVEDKTLALIMFDLVKEYMPEFPVEIQADIAARLCIQYKKENEEE